MPSLEPKAFAAAKEKLVVAKGKLDAMKLADNIDQLDQHWGEFLTECIRAFLRLKKATEHGPAKGWCDNVIHEQRTDDLLRYILHARDAAEHGIEKITEKKHGGVAIKFKPQPGSNSVFVKNLSIETGPQGLKIAADEETLTKIRVEFVPGSVRLIRVVDRGTPYDPPTMHRGRPIAKSDPVTVAELAIRFLEEKLAEAEATYGA